MSTYTVYYYNINNFNAEYDDLINEYPDQFSEPENIFQDTKFWRPSSELIKLKNHLHNITFYDFPGIACAYCSTLMFISEISWELFNENFEYPLIRKFLNEKLHFHPNSSIQKIAICNSCKRKWDKPLPPDLLPIPSEIATVPMYNRQFLSPIHLRCSLGRHAGSNSYINYRHLTGSFGYSRNIHVLALYSGELDAFFIIQTPHRTAQNQYTNLIHTDNSQNIQDIVVPSYDYDTETHDEDFNYQRLMAGFMLPLNLNMYILISIGSDHLEPLLFPDLFPYRTGFFSKENTNLSY
ncbi:31255_t:CDS:2, partial [Racocetra persica]